MKCQREKVEINGDILSASTPSGGVIAKNAVGQVFADTGAFMVEIETGTIYQIKGYGKVDKKKNIGNIYDPAFDAAVLVRDRFRYGRFQNNPDGSIPAGTQEKQ